MICGIDPGLTGAIAFIEHDKLCSVEKVPVSKIKEGKAVNALTALVFLASCSIALMCLLRNNNRCPNWFSSTFRTGFGYGLYIGILIYADCNYHSNTKRMETSLWPYIGWDLNEKGIRDIDTLICQRQKNQDGLAEAALIAHFGANGSHPF